MMKMKTKMMARRLMKMNSCMMIAGVVTVATRRVTMPTMKMRMRAVMETTKGTMAATLKRMYLNDPEETEGPFEQSRSQLEDDGTPKEDAVADKPPCQPPHAEVEEQHPPIDVPKVDPEDFAFSAVQVAEREHQSPKTKHEMIRFLAKLEEPLDASITQRQSRAVGTRTRVPGIESSRDHGRERRKRSFLAGDEDEDSNHGSDGSSRSKRAKTSHEPSTPTPDGPSRKRSRESMESEDDELDGLDSEEEVSNQVTPRPDRGDPSLTSVADAKGKGKTRAQDDGPGSGSPKRARTDVGPFALVARETKDEKVNWFKEVVAQVSTPSASRQSVASGSRSGSTSKLSSFPPRLPLHLAPPPVPLELRPPSLLIPDIRVNFRGPPRGPPRPLRRETECLRENAFGEPEVYHVHDVHGRQLPSPSPSSSSASSSSRD
ncbi:hypothetical protein BS17DRAFT_278403 [Gyrodon lividus]|nr:hypothetical protein BS17DRAFT_278403 [Gyrodon lividus]